MNTKINYSVKKNPMGKISLPSGAILEIKILIDPTEKAKGLSGVTAQNFPHNKAMLFFFKNFDLRSFWMPNTYFNLDIFFLDEKLKVLDIERNLPAHPGWAGQIPRAKERIARHVLEIRSDSLLAKEIKLGMNLNWIEPFPWPKMEKIILKEFQLID